MAPGFDKELFLREYWQKQPLLIPSIGADLSALPTPDELAGLALEDDIESRIISCDKGRWQLEHGPFSAKDYNRHDQWTLLVQRVDHYLPEVAELKQLVDFLPGWRFDDVMVSYAVDGGGVGPHFDRYDVFLLQGAGRRRWRLGQLCDAKTPLQAHRDLSLLADFDVTQEFVLEPGDMLYVPPGVAHWGVAEGECITYSLGFRAPSMANVLAARIDQALASLDESLLLEDAGSIAAGQRPGEIAPQQLQNARAAFDNALAALDDGSWFGCLVTDGADDGLEEDIEIHDLADGDIVCLVSGIRVAWRECDDYCEVYCSGEAFPAPLACHDLLVALCRGDNIEVTPLSLDGRALLQQLSARGALIAN